jgi:putative methyltransferase
MFVERDNLIIDKLIEVQKRWGKVTSFSMTWAKNQKNEVVDMVKKLIDLSPNFGQGLTVSVQSMDNTVLENIKRRNLDQHKIDQIFDLCDRRNIPVYTEVILGLPGETVASWRETFWRIFRAGNHTGINILQAQLLENAEMNLMQKKLWRLESVPIYDYMSGSYGDMDLSESVDVVIATREIDREAMLDTLVWNTFIQTFHINGLTTYISRFMRQYKKIDYAEFYDRLEQRISSHAWLHEQFEQTRHYFQNWTVKGRADHPDIAGVQIFGWNLVHRVTLLMQQQGRIASVQHWIEQFVRQEFDLDAHLANQLLDFQRNYVINHADMRTLPKIRTYDYDFLGFIQDASNLEQVCTLCFASIEDKNMSLTKFLEGMYFYRKRNFGKTIITRIHNARTTVLDCA